MSANFIRRLMRWLNKYYLSLLKTDPHSNPEGFEGLTPYVEEDAEKHYKDPSTKALEKALDDPAIRNIAVTGSFGAGKSSFLRTFETHHMCWNYINISLATFKAGESDEKGETNQLIERSILQQLLYKVKKDTIPQSQFNKIQKIYFVKSLLPIVSVLVWLLTYIAIFQTDIARKILFFQKINIPEICYSFIGKSFCNYSVILLFFSTSLVLIWRSYKYLSSFRVTKFTSKGGVDVTKVSEDDAESFLNKNLDEIMYFFEATPYNIVVIEDLDRSKNPEIFIKLREINELINKSDQIAGRVKFIYALKDEIFTDEERTKFFDFIIPIIPIINRSNSYSIIRDKLPAFKSKNEFQTLLKEVSQYIEDMRLLINIVNEFKIYDKKINKEIDRKKLFSMIVYKNMFPADFAALHKSSGVLSAVFKSKNKYIQVAISHLEKEIKVHEIAIKALEEKTDWVDELKELRAIYIQKFIQENDINHDATTSDQDGNKILLFDSINNENNFNLIRNNSSFSHTVPIQNGKHNYNNQHSNLEEIKYDFSTIEKLVNSSFSYDERREIIKGKYERDIQNLKRKIEKFDSDTRKIKGHKVSELVNYESVNKLFINESHRLIEKNKKDEKNELGTDDYKDEATDNNINETSNNNVRLFRYFIRNELIDENYLDSVSYFHDNDDALLDYEFLLQARDQKTLPINYTLRTPKEIIKELHYRDFESHSVLNFDLVDELLQTQRSFPEKLKSFSKLICTDDERVHEFIEEYFEFTKNEDLFISLLIKEKHNFIKFIQNNKKFSAKKKDEYLAVILKSSTVEDITSLNEGNHLQELIENKTDFIEFVEKYNLTSIQDKTKELLDELYIKFHSLSGLDKNNELSQYIFTNDHYRLSPEMIDTIIDVFHEGGLNPKVKEKMNFAHLTTLKKLSFEPLMKYIDSDIEKYVNDCFLHIEGNTKESETTIVDLLNHDETDIELCNKILLKEEIKITDVTLINHKYLWDILFKNNRIEPTWSNVLSFYKKGKDEESMNE